MTPREMVAGIDWTTRPHSYGHEPSVLTVWDAEFEANEAAREEADGETLGNLVCHQSTISSAAFALVEPLLVVAKSEHPRRHLAIELLAWFLSTSGGNAEHAARCNARMATVPNPFKPGQLMTAPAAPDEDAIDAERAAIRQMRERVEAQLETWTELARNQRLDWHLRQASLWLLSRVLYHPDADEAEQLVRQVHAGLDRDERESMSWIIEDLDRQELEDQEDEWDDDEEEQ